MSAEPLEAGAATPGPVLALRHQKVQRLRRLLSRRTARDAERVFVLEGTKLVHEALDAGVHLESLYVAVGTRSCVGGVAALVERAVALGTPVHELAPGVIERVADTVTPQPVLAVIPFVDRPRQMLRGARFLVVAVDVRDPGNAGTILRSAAAAGCDGVVLCEGSVDLYNPKTVRASAGSLFQVPVAVGGNPTEVLADLERWGVRRLATTVSGGRDYTQVDLTGPTAFVLGNEANGLTEEVEAAVEDRVTIPMAGRSESINVGMAAAVLCFEAARQRRHAAVAP